MVYFHLPLFNTCIVGQRIYLSVYIFVSFSDFTHQHPPGWGSPGRASLGSCVNFLQGASHLVGCLGRWGPMFSFYDTAPWKMSQLTFFPDSLRVPFL